MKHIKLFEKFLLEKKWFNRNASDNTNSIKRTLKTGEIITLKVDTFMLGYNSINITAYDKNNNKIGAAYFNSDKTNNPKILSSTDTSVKSQWRRKGVATAIYDFAKTFGYQIIKSKEQTSDGKNFTDSLNL